MPSGSPFWGLDRVNQRVLPLDGSTTTTCYPRRGAGVTAYIVDYGLEVGHTQFEGSATAVVAPGARYPEGSDA